MLPLAVLLVLRAALSVAATTTSATGPTEHAALNKNRTAKGSMLRRGHSKLRHRPDKVSARTDTESETVLTTPIMTETTSAQARR